MDVQQETYAEGRASVVERRPAARAARRLRLAQLRQRQELQHDDDDEEQQRRTTLSESRRFFVLLLGAHGCICASAGYLYNLFSGQLQQKYNYTQKEMATITTTSSILGVVTFPLAMVYDYHGPRPVYLIGAAAFPLGATLLSLTLADVVVGTVARITVYMTLLGVGTSMFDLASLMTVMAHFPSSRGAVIAVMKTFIGLGAAVFGVVQVGFFGNNLVDFLYFTAAYVALVGLLCSVFVTLPPYQLTAREERHATAAERARRLATKRPYLEQAPPARRFALGFVIVAALIVFLPVQSSLVAFAHIGARARVALAVVAVALVASYSLIAAPLRWLDAKDTSETTAAPPPTVVVVDDNNDHNDDDSTVAAAARRRNADTGVTSAPPPSRGMTYAAASDDASAARLSRGTRTRASIAESALFSPQLADETLYMAPQYQTTFCQSLATPQLWLFVYSLFCIYGAQGVIINNARFIYAAVARRSISDELAALLTIIIGAGSAIGRVAMSAFEIWTQKRAPQQRIPLTVVMYIPSTTMLLASLLLLVVPAQLLLLPFVLTALGNGFTAASVVLVMRTVYARDIGNHYTFISIGSVLSSVLLNQLLYGGYYTHEAQKQHSTVCYGRACIGVPFQVITLLVLTSMMSNAYVHARYRAYCASVIARTPANSSDDDEDDVAHTPCATTTAESTQTNDDNNERQPLLRHT